jgi:hypothetical protein
MSHRQREVAETINATMALNPPAYLDVTLYIPTVEFGSRYRFGSQVYIRAPKPVKIWGFLLVGPPSPNRRNDSPPGIMSDPPGSEWAGEAAANN